jgi:hypothetical protein
MGDPRAKTVVIYNGGNFDGTAKTADSAQFNGTLAYFNGGLLDMATVLVSDMLFSIAQY